MTIKTPNVKKALFLAKRHLPEFVCDAVNLEGINYTLPEVQTLLQGVTVGGHKLSDQMITLNQARAWEFLFKAIETEKFAFTKTFVCELHCIAAENEALKWGQFRDGKVTIAGTSYLPPEPNQLDHTWQTMLTGAEKITDIYEKAIFIFLQMIRTKFFYGMNKRMGRFMMNGLLMSQGYPAINLPAKRQQEFNRLMLEFYVNNNAESMTAFMISCILPIHIEIMNELN